MILQLRQIFSKDIERNINPAVVVSEQDKTTVQTEIEEYVYSLAIEQLSDISLVDENYCPFSHMILHSFRVGNVNISRSKITVEYTFKYTNRLYLESLNAFVSNQIHDYSKKGEIGAELICIGDIDVESDKFSVISFRKKQVLL